jgi:hypothetical protein
LLDFKEENFTSRRIIMSIRKRYICIRRCKEQFRGEFNVGLFH